MFIVSFPNARKWKHFSCWVLLSLSNCSRNYIFSWNIQDTLLSFSWPEVELASSKWRFLYCKSFTSYLPNTSNAAAFMPSTHFIVNLVFPNCLSFFKSICLSDKAIANFLRLGFVWLYWSAKCLGHSICHFWPDAYAQQLHLRMW